MPSSERWLLRAVTLGEDVVDCRLRDGHVAEIGPALVRGEGETELYARGGALLPGLADHHLHLRSMAAVRRSVDLRGAPIESAVGAPGAGLLRVIGAAEAATRTELDRLWPERPVRVQHRSGALWTLNSAALALLDGDLEPEQRENGRFWRASSRLRALSPADDGDALAAVSGELAAYGVTHVTDATPDAGPPSPLVCQHVLSLAAGGDGPRKLVIADHEPPDYARLSAAVRAAHGAGRGVAVHTVTSASLAMIIAVLTELGPHPQDRIEHAAVCTDDAARCLAGLAVPVITQPTLYERHGAHYRRDAEPAERHSLWRYGGLLHLGVRVAASSDAPYGDADPWATIRAASARVPEAERVPAATTLASMLTPPTDPAGAPRTVHVGAPADLCLLAERDLTAWLFATAPPARTRVAATFIAGTLVHRGPDFLPQ